MCLLAFYVQQTDSTTWRGTLMMICLLIAAELVAYPIGERTNLLLPLVICVLFHRQLRLSQLLAVLAVTLLCAACLLPIMKAQYADANKSMSTLLGEMIYVDLARAPLLADIIAHADGLESRVLPYPGAGYVYSLCLFSPARHGPL